MAWCDCGETDREMNGLSGYILVEEFTGPGDGLEAGVKVNEGGREGQRLGFWYIGQDGVGAQTRSRVRVKIRSSDWDMLHPRCLQAQHVEMSDRELEIEFWS